MKKLENKLDYSFKNKELLTRALTHRSATTKNNEKLEFLGDSVLSTVISEYLYENLTDANEGKLTHIRSSLVRRETLSELASKLELSEILILSSGVLKSGGFKSDSILANCFEAVIGAIFLDSDYITVKRCILDLYSNKIKTAMLTKLEKDPKTRLQEWLQKNKYSLPTYEVIKSEGAMHQLKFTVQCEVQDLNLIASSSALSKQEAEQNTALKILEMINED